MTLAHNPPFPNDSIPELADGALPDSVEERAPAGAAEPFAESEVLAWPGRVDLDGATGNPPNDGSEEDDAAAVASDETISPVTRWDWREGGGRALIDLVEAAGAGLVRVDLDGTATALNPSGVLLLEAVGGADSAPAPAVLLDALAAAALDGFPTVRDVVTQTPESRHIGVTALVQGEDQLIALRDHTEERLLQERLLQSEKMASVGQLVSGVAHELNNPLTAVTGFAQVLLARPDLDATARAQLQMVYEEGERAAKIVQNLLSFARRRRPAKEMTDINVLVERVLELRSYDFGMRNISLDMTLDRRMARVWLDPDQVQQVLFNLVKNAEQAMTDANGGGNLSVRSLVSANGRGVRVTIADDGPGIAAEVQRRIFDPFFTTKEAGQGTGLGLTICYSIIDEHNGRIWAENVPAADGRPAGAIFTIELPLERQAASTTQHRDDAGEAFGPPEEALNVTPGQEALASELMAGPTRQPPEPGSSELDRRVEGPELLSDLYPPASSPEPVRLEALEGPNGDGEGTPATVRPLRILVVDDEESIRLLLSDVLTMDGHEVDLAATGIEAMGKLTAARYDIIVSDLKMPGMDGATLYRELRRNYPDLADRLIFITGDTVSPDTRAFLSSTPAPVLTKPFRVATLREAIEEVVAAGRGT